ncbi:YceD family protein [Marinicella sp. S1101]|uniref:YceD family protein n=1 Tax=Marinicella marina TaxID=2996016 RepID=UPI002260FC26|nr:YceD family protein [Marinicella marina]MCX7555038.1 YceD family protein [Marinicella marina]MDJ1141298.1 YceD family protein [Marinicella marina]
MAKSLPESIDLNAAVRKEWQLSGELLLSDLDRMPAELIASADAPIKYEIQFRHSKSVLGEAIIRIEAQLELICQRSLEQFKFELITHNTIGFISEIEDEAKLDADVMPSWVEDMQVEPKALLEDEILLKIPDIPLKPGAELNSEYLVNGDDEEPTNEETQSPFAALKQLKDKN